MRYKSHLKHTSTIRARAEGREKKVVKGLRFIKDDLRVVKEEFQAAKEELCAKATVLDLARREASEAESSVERLAKECSALRGGEFYDEICQNLPFDYCPWLVSDVELIELYGPFDQSSRGF